MRIAGVILAGGQSRRMDGLDKALLPFGEKRVIDHVYERLSRQITPVVLNSNNEPVLFMDLPIPVVPDDIEGFAGPLAGILAAMEWANGQALPFTHIATVATDTPFFPEDLVDALRRALAGERGRICVAASGGRPHPVFGIWPVSLRSDLRRWLSNENHRRVMGWLEGHPHKVVEFPIRTAQSGMPLDPFFNINTPADINEARRWWNAIS